jgi:hypothetical protein
MGTFTVTGDWTAQGNLSGSAVFIPQPESAGSVVSTTISEGVLNTSLSVIDGRYLATFIDLALDGSPGVINSFAFECPTAGATVDLNTTASPAPVFPVGANPALGTFTVTGGWSGVSGDVLFIPQPETAGTAVATTITNGSLSATLPVIIGDYLTVFLHLTRNGLPGSIASFAFMSPSDGATVDLNTTAWPQPVFPVIQELSGTFTATGDWSSAGDVSGTVIFMPMPATAGEVTAVALTNGALDTTVPMIAGTYLVLFEGITLNGDPVTINGFALTCPSVNTTVNLNTVSSPPAIIQINTPPSLGTFTVSGSWTFPDPVSGTVLFVPEPETSGTPVVATITNGLLAATLPVIEGSYAVVFLGVARNGLPGTIKRFSFESPSADTSVNLNTTVSPAPVYTPTYWNPGIEESP